MKLIDRKMNKNLIRALRDQKLKKVHYTYPHLFQKVLSNRLSRITDHDVLLHLTNKIAMKFKTAHHHVLIIYLSKTANIPVRHSIKTLYEIDFSV
jgi:hypothetical protein